MEMRPLMDLHTHTLASGTCVQYIEGESGRGEKKWA